MFNAALSLGVGSLAAAEEVAPPPALEEVVVTAERRTTNLQTTGISASVLTGADLANKGIMSVQLQIGGRYSQFKTSNRVFETYRYPALEIPIPDFQTLTEEPPVLPKGSCILTGQIICIRCGRCRLTLLV